MSWCRSWGFEPHRDPLNPDTDGYGVDDSVDAAPLDPTGSSCEFAEGRMEIRLDFLRGSLDPANPEVVLLRETWLADCPGTVLELMTLNDKNDTIGVCPTFLSA